MKKLILPLFLGLCLAACGDDTDVEVDVGPPDAAVVDMEEAKEATIDVIEVPEDAEPEVAGD